jgi:phosphoribosylaminoimidazolecarboxamide formyltransferase / IMP cyclohydrolase
VQRFKARRALISVSDKTGIIELSRDLVGAEIEIIASDGTAALLRESGIPVRTVTDFTGFPEMLQGKVKTLHPLIHGAILANEKDLVEVGEKKIELIDLVIANFYPSDFFDIGGPAMVRAAAKNHQRVAIITSTDQYGELRDSLREGSAIDQRKRWARSAIALTANYDLEITRDLGSELRYGENPHQRGWISGEAGLAGAPLLQGKAMSYNNYLDADAALSTLEPFKAPTIAIIKHGIPAGVASASSIERAFSSALACDPLSSFGGVIATNRTVTEELATAIAQSFFEVIVATDFDQQALQILAAKKNLRLIAMGGQLNSSAINREPAVRAISGGFLFQERDKENLADNPDQWTLVSGAPISDFAELQFAWRVVRSVRSNAIVISKDCATVGIGSGQVNRLDAARLATTRAGMRAQGSFAASDAFFPFPDGVQVLIDAGITALVQPGGSVRDEEVISLAQSAGITMYLTGTRHFSHN